MTDTLKIEKTILAILLQDASQYMIVEDILDDKKSFRHPSLRLIFRAIKKIISEDLFPDALSVIYNLDEMGKLEELSITDTTDGESKVITGGENVVNYLKNYKVEKSEIDNLETYAIYLAEATAKDELKKLLDEMLILLSKGLSTFELLTKMDLESGKIAAHSGFSSNNLVSSKTAVESVARDFVEALNGHSRYIETKWAFWNDFVAGLYPGRVYIVAAASNNGKSALVHNLVYDLAVDGVKNRKTGDIVKHKIGLISLEMTSKEVVNRLVQIRTGISPLSIEKGELSESDQIELKNSLSVISPAPIVFDESSELSVAALRTRMRKMVADGCKVIIIDQLEQLKIGGSGDNQALYIVLNFITYRIKAIAKELGVPVVLVHQLNRGMGSAEREKGQGKVEPSIGDLAQAGEKAVDAILIITHEREKNKIVSSSVTWVKNRQGQKGKSPVRFIGKYIRFEDAEIDSPDFAQE